MDYSYLGIFQRTDVCVFAHDYKKGQKVPAQCMNSVGSNPVSEACNVSS